MATKKKPTRSRRKGSVTLAMHGAALRQTRVTAAGAQRLLELMSVEERASVMLAMQVQARREKMPERELRRITAVFIDLLLPEWSFAMRIGRAHDIKPSVKWAADPTNVLPYVKALGEPV